MNGRMYSRQNPLLINTKVSKKEETKMANKDLLSVEINEVIWDSKGMTLTLYYEDADALSDWCERHKKAKDKPTFLKDITYDLTNPNQMFNILCKVRNYIISSGIESKNIYKDYRTFDSWFQALEGLRVNLNDYGYLA